VNPAPHSPPVFSAFAQLLEEERAAIRALDGSKLDKIAEQKVSLMDRLSDMDQADRLANAGSIKNLVAELRHNGVLLVHARGIIRDVLRIKGAQIAEPTLQRPGFGSMPPVSQVRPRLSVRG
jgi:flagellar biosynthesis/type III secretory pathway chaperone